MLPTEIRKYKDLTGSDDNRSLVILSLQNYSGRVHSARRSKEAPKPMARDLRYDVHFASVDAVLELAPSSVHASGSFPRPKPAAVSA